MSEHVPIDDDAPIEDDTPESSPIARAPQPRLRVGAMLAGGALGLVVVIIAAIAYLAATGERTPRLTEAEYLAAAQRWEENGPADYLLDLELTGNRPGKVHVEVRDRQPVRMTRDGVQPRQERTWFYWTVPGMLDTIAEELEMVKDPAGSFGAPQASQVVIWAEFDPKYGYPRKYDRVVLGTDFEIHWQVTNFQPLAAE